MAKAYDFTIQLQRVTEIGPHHAVVAYGKGHTLLSERFQGTLKEAIARRDVVSAEESRSHEASIRMTFRDDRMAPGLGKVERTIKEGAFS